MQLKKSDLVVLTFEVEGQVQLDRALGVYRTRAQDLRGVWPAVQSDFLYGERKQFATEGQSGSGGWEALSPAYAAWKSVNFPGRPILQRTRRLYKSLTNKSHGDAIYEPGKRGVTLGTKTPYARYHQTGTRKMPMRRPVHLTDAQRKRWMKMIHEYIIKTDQGISIMPGQV